MSKSIAIIGAGGAGLALGCYARMNGYDCDIYELHNLPGGLCTSWKRKGYLVDGCLHWLVGSTPAGGALYQCWKELGALEGRRFIDHEVFARTILRDGREFRLYSNIDRLETHMKELAPEDGKTIEEFCDLCRSLAKVDLPIDKPKELQSLGDKLRSLVKILPMALPFMKYKTVSIHDFAAKFKNPALREAFPVTFNMPDFPIIAMAFSLAWMHNQTAGYPVGGSLEFSRAIEKRFLGLGGRVHYQSRVEKVLVTGGRAVGLRLADGAEHRADVVVSAADGYDTIFRMLDGKFADQEIKDRFDQTPRFPGLIQASFGIKRAITDEASMTFYQLDQPVTVAGEEQKYIMLHNYSYDPTVAPEGKAVIVFRLGGNWEFWKKAKENPATYEAEKEKVANFFMGFLESKFPGISEDVEMVDIATPTTFERYTNNFEGSMEGWLLTTKNLSGAGMKKTLPGLDNFYMIGQWVAPGGGLPGCAITAKEVIQLICHRDGKAFVTTNP